MAVEIAGVTLCPRDELITGAALDSPRTGPVDGYAFAVHGWVISKAPIVKVEFVHEGNVVECCQLNVSRPDVAAAFGCSSQVGFGKSIETVGLTPAFTIEVWVVIQDGRRREIAEIRGTPSRQPGAGPMHDFDDATNSFRMLGVPYLNFLAALHTHLTPRTYLEVGTAAGSSLAVAGCDTIAVDPRFQLEGSATGNRRRTFFFQMTSDDFFATENAPALLGRPVDMAFLDGMHRFEYLLRDLIGTEAACHPRSLILLHDCVPLNPRMALRQWLPGGPSETETACFWTGDVWKLLPILKKYRPDLRLHVLDCPPTGLVAITGLDPASSVLADRYHEIVDEHVATVLDDNRLRSFWEELKMADSRPLCEEPDRLTELFTRYPPEEFRDRASSDPGPDLLPRGRFPLRDWPPSDGTLTVIEAPKVEQLRPPEFVCNLSGKAMPDWFSKGDQIDVHGSYLVSRSDVLLFGQNHLVSQSGLWSCETRTGKRHWLENVTQPYFSHTFPGVKPGIEFEGNKIALDCSTLNQYDVHSITEPVFLATPLEPENWGRWITTVLPKCAQFKKFGPGRKFFSRAAHPWQRDLMHLMGIAEDQVLVHDPGKTYFCRDALTVEYSVADLSVSEAEKQVYAELADACRRDSPDTFGERIFVSRLSRSAKHPHYRVLQNECDLIAALEKLGFTTVEPEQLPVKQQIGMFARAKCVVALGGAGLFNVRFCPPGTTVVDIESSDIFRGHSGMLSSVGHRYGVIFGQQDPADPAPVHKRWTIDVQGACNAIREIL